MAGKAEYGRNERKRVTSFLKNSLPHKRNLMICTKNSEKKWHIMQLKIISNNDTIMRISEGEP